MSETDILKAVLKHIVVYRGLSALKDIAEAHGRERRKSSEAQVAELASFFTEVSDLVRPKSGWTASEWNNLLEESGFERRRGRIGGTGRIFKGRPRSTPGKTASLFRFAVR